MTSPIPERTAIVMPGGGARAAYQVGFLRCLAEHMPEVRFPIITGISAGAINAAFLASWLGDLRGAGEALTELWSDLTPDRVFRVDSGGTLARNTLRWGVNLVSGGHRAAPPVRGMLDTQPLRRLMRRTLGTEEGDIPGIASNLDAGQLRAFALTTLNYSTGQTVTWVQGREMSGWER